jgi:putative flippase GtrA
MSSINNKIPKHIFHVEQKEAKQVVKFIAVGLLNTIVGYGSFFILSYYTYYLIALILSHFIGVTHSYLWNKYWTFGTQKNHIKEFIKFNVIYLIILIANVSLLGFLVEALTVNPRIGQLIALPLVTIISYFGHRYWSFNGK